jgi:hypothetical protein
VQQTPSLVGPKALVIFLGTLDQRFIGRHAGHVGIFGKGVTGTEPRTSIVRDTRPGSGGGELSGFGPKYGGGGGSPDNKNVYVGNGAVRIVWPGKNRKFPNKDVNTDVDALDISVTSDVTTVNEDGKIAFTILAPNFPPGGVLYWRTTSSNSTITSRDFADNLNAGALKIVAGKATIVRVLSKDFKSENAETVVFQVAGGGTNGYTLAETSVVIQDTSKETVFIKTNIDPLLTIEEGKTLIFFVKGKGINSATFDWEMTGTLTDTEFTINGEAAPIKKTGTITMSNGIAQLSLFIKKDYITDGSKSIQLILKSKLTNGIVAKSDVIEVVDSSKLPVESCKISTSSTEVEEGGAVMWKVEYTNIVPGTLLKLVSVPNSSDIEEKTFTIAQNDSNYDSESQRCTGVENVETIIKTDQLTEGPENLTISVIKVSPLGVLTTMGTSTSPLKIKDSSKGDLNYKISVNKSKVFPGETIEYSLTTIGSENGDSASWVIDGSGEGILDTNSTTGTATIQNNKAKITLNLIDVVISSPKTLTFSILGVAGNKLLPNSIVTCIPRPTATITPNTTDVNENEVGVTFTVSTNYIDNNTMLYWKNVGTTIGADFVDGLNTGVVKVVSDDSTGKGSCTIVRSLKLDTLTESETIKLELRLVNNSLQPLATSVEVNALDAKSYQIICDKTEVVEGESATFTIKTKNVTDGSTINWTIAPGGGFSSGDIISGSQIAGSVTITDNTSEPIIITPIIDSLVEKSEYIVINATVGTGPAVKVVATSPKVFVADVPGYTLVVDKKTSTISRGNFITFTIQTTNVKAGKKIYWKNIGTAGTGNFTDGLNSGEISVVNTVASLRKVLKTYVGAIGETIRMEFRVDTPDSGPVIATSDEFVIKTLPTYEVEIDKPIVLGQASIFEGESVTFTVKTTNIDDGEIITWSNAGTTNSLDFEGMTVAGPKGQIVVQNNTATFTLTLKTDSTEPMETLLINFLYKTAAGTINRSAPRINVFGKPTYKVLDISYSELVDEGKTLNYSINTSDVPNGTKLYWKNIGTATANDFVQNITDEFVTIQNNLAKLSLTLMKDLITEGNTDTVQLEFSIEGGEVVATSKIVTISDVSIRPTVLANLLKANFGDTILFTLQNMNYTELYWENIGTTTANDFVDGKNKGVLSSKISTPSTVTISRQLKNTIPTESKTVQLAFRASSSGDIIATSPVLAIDIPDLTISVKSSAVAGDTLTYAISVLNISNDKKLFYKNIKTPNISANSTGSVTIKNGGATFNVLLKKPLTESGEIQLEFRVDSASGTILKMSPITTITP